MGNQTHLDRFWSWLADRLPVALVNKVMLRTIAGAAQVYEGDGWIFDLSWDIVMNTWRRGELNPRTEEEWEVMYEDTDDR